MENKKVLLSYLLVALAGCLYANVVFGVKILANMGMSVSELLILPNIIIVFLLWPFILKKYDTFFLIPKPFIYLFCITSVFTQIGQYVPLFLGLSVSLVELLIYTQPLWTIIFSIAFFKNKLKKQDVLICFLVIMGLIILINPFDDMKFSVSGIVLALLAGIGLSSFVLFNTYASKKGVSSLVFVFFSNVFLSIPFLFSYPFINKVFYSKNFMRFELDFPIQTWVVLFVYSISCYILAPVLFFFGSKHIPVVHSGLLLLLEPVVAVILDIIFLHFNLTWNIMIGGTLIILANVYIVLSGVLNRKKVRLYREGICYGCSKK